MELLKKFEHHRCRTRIKNFGEVFTPENYTKDLLNLVGNKNAKIWSDEAYTFFEPSCGHGNFCDAIIEKRLEAFYQKAIKNKQKQPSLYAVSNSINNLWAVDIDEENINLTRERLLTKCLLFIVTKNDSTTNFLLSFIDNNLDFLSHLVCALKWQIYENEALSSLGTDKDAEKTKIGKLWLVNNKHKRIDFDLTWAEYFRELYSNNVKVVEFESVKRLIKMGDFKKLRFVERSLKNLTALSEAA